MKAVLFVFVFLPLILCAFSVLFGMARLSRIFGFFLCWSVLSFVIFVLLPANGFIFAGPLAMIMGIGAAKLLMMLSIWAALFFGLATNPKKKESDPAPIDYAQVAYQNLDDAQKEKVKECAKSIFRSATRSASASLRKKGYRISAKAVNEATKII